MRRFVVLLGLVAALGAAALFFRGRAPDAPAGRPNILLVTVDTLRADRTGRGLTPAIDALAIAGRRFTGARATVPLTLPSHVSIMTGTIPPVHGVRENGVVFKGAVPTLAGVLNGNGYATGAFVGAYVLDRRFGLAEGFSTYDDRVPRNPDADARLEAERPAAAVVDPALDWLKSATEPFFAWVHLYDPHAPYGPPAEFRGKSASPYDGEVAYADAQIARLIEALRARGIAGSTVVAVTGDHGEGLGEHGEQTHGMLAYDTTLRVPLAIAGPGIEPAEIRTPVSLADLAPSLLRRAGIISGLSPQAGTVDLLTTAAADRDVYAETAYPRSVGWHPLAVLAGEQWKLILSSEPELFDISADPGETRNLAAERSAIVQGMQGRLAALEREAPVSAAGGAAVPAEAAERLRALGYVSGGGSTKVDSSSPNPARAIEAWTRFEEALALVSAGRAADAVTPLQALAKAHPEARLFQTTLARALQESGKARAAVEVYRAAAARWPADATVFHDLAVAARAAGDPAEAMKAEEAALALDKDSPAAQNGLGLLHADAGRATDAAAAFERAAKGDPSNASYWANLGNARRELADLTGAESAYRRALESDGSHPDAANGLGVILVQQRRPAEAIAWFERALARTPAFYEARLNLGIALQESGQPEKAAVAYREILDKAPATFARERQAAGELLRSLGR